jgi:hypothetical protein
MLRVSASPDRPADGPGNDQSRLAAVLRAAAAGAGDTGQDWLLGEAVAGGLAIADGMAGCSITERDGDRFSTRVFAGQAALQLDLIQYGAGRGPCVSAVRDREVHAVHEDSDLLRLLPGWPEKAARYGVRAVLSIPLTGLRAGVNFYAADPASLDAPVVTARAGLLGRVISLLFTDSPPSGQPAADHVAARAELDLARSIIARREHISDDEAFSWLAQQSARERRSIRATARDVLGDPGSQTDQSCR